MALQNHQFNKILREYDSKILRNKRNLALLTEEIYNHIPALKELDASIAEASIKCAKLSLFGDSDNLNELQSLIKAAPLERERLLVSHGYPKNYLEPMYDCSDCKDTGFIEREKCHCFKQAVVDILYSQSNIRSILEQENFSALSFDYYSKDYIEPSIGLTPYENMIQTVSLCKNFIESFDKEHHNLLLYGNTGVGKTFLANCIAKELLDTAHTVIYLTAFQLFDILEKNKFDKGEDNYEFQTQFQYILDCDLLIIDDLGTELTNSFVNVQLYLCINERLLRRKSTIVSTNLSLDNINTIYSERVFSRIASNYTLLKIVGEDIRLKKLF